MKVLMLHDCAGVGLHLRDLLQQRGFTVDLYFFRLNSHPYLDYGSSLMSMSKHEVAWFVMKKVLEDYDIVHTYNTRFPNHPLPYEYVLAKLVGKKVVVHFHGSDLRLGYKKISRKILLRNKTLLVSTPDLLQFCPSRAIWLPNPVDPNMFYPFGEREAHDETRILHSSTMPEIKGTTHLIRSVEELRKKGYKIDLKIVGKPNPVPISEMPKLYNWADIVVNEILLPIHSLVGIEAMMCKKLVLSSYRIPRSISDPPIVDISPETLTEMLERFIRHPELRDEIASRGRDWAIENHNPEKIADRLVKIYEEA